MYNREIAFRELVKSYDAVALVANNEHLDVEDAKKAVPDNTLFVFFGHTKVLSRNGFDRPCVLVQVIGPELTYILSPSDIAVSNDRLSGGYLKGTIALLRGIKGESFDHADDENVIEPRAEFLVDTLSMTDGWFTDGKSPTTGFSMALWFLDNFKDKQVWLCGFSGTAGGSLKNDSKVHDFALEQAVLAVESERGNLVHYPPKKDGLDSFDALRQRYPDMPVGQLAGIYASGLSRRLDAADMLAQRSWRRLNPQYSLYKRIIRLRLWRFFKKTK